MNLKQLEVFIAVAECGSFSRAAELCYLTQSTVSQHISALEKEFGLKLLDRTGKGALLTEAGKLLHLHACRLAEEARSIPAALNRFKGLEEVVIRIGGSNIPSSYLLPGCIPPFQRSHPGVTITILQGDSRETLDRLKREDVELAVIGSKIEDEEVCYADLATDRLALVIYPGHRWEGKDSVSLDELREEVFIFREPGSGTDMTVRNALVKAGLAPEKLNVRTFLGSNEAVKQAILSGAGVSFLSMISVRRECESGQLSMLDVEGLDMSRHFYLVSRKARELSPAAAAFVSVMAGQFSVESRT